MLHLSDLSKGVELSKLSTLNLTSQAELFKAVSSFDEAKDLFALIKEKKLPYWILGKGSNTLFDDQGVKGVVIHNKIVDIACDGSTFKVGAGFSFSYLGMMSSKKGFSGLEFAAGIPGSVGGAIFMNAGIGSADVSSVLKKVGFLYESGEFIELDASACAFTYRSSIFHTLKGMIIYGIFELEKRENTHINQKKLLKQRYATQPYKDKTLGCFFRNPQGASAGQLIDELGLKGAMVGGAKVSTQHANFLVNQGGATKADFLSLIEQVKSRVKKERGFELKTEIRVAVPEKMEEDV